MTRPASGTRISDAVVKAASVINTCESATGFSIAGGGGSAYAADATNVRPGYTSSIKVTTPSTSGTSVELNFPAFSKTIQGKVGVWVFVPEYSKLTNIIVYVGKDSGYTDNINRTYGFTADDKQYSGWHFISFQVADASDSTKAWTVVGSGAPPGTYVAAKLRVTPAAVSVEGQTSVWVGPMVYDYHSRPKLMIWGDDAYDSWYDFGISYLDTKGLKCSIAAIADQIGESGYMTLAELKTAYNTGHDVAVHGETNLATLATYSAIRADVEHNRDFLLDNDMPRAARHYVYPNGVYEISSGDYTIRNAINDAGMLTARGTVRKITIETYGIDSGLYYCMIIGHQNTDTLTNVLAQIDNGIRNGQTMILMFHKILEGAGAPANAIEIQKDDATYGFQQIIDGVVTRVNQGLLDVVTVSEWYNSL